MINLKPKKVRIIVGIIFLIGAIVGIIGTLSDKTAIAVVGMIVVLCSVIFNFIFYRCPYCGKYLDRSTGDYCPYCGEDVNE